MGDEEFDVMMAAQREELGAAKTLSSDFDYAFSLQMREAITASLALGAASASASQSSLALDNAVYEEKDDAVALVPMEDDDVLALVIEDLNRLDQERWDRELSELEARRVREDLDRRIHDQKFAREIMDIPENEWLNYGDDYHKPYCGSSSSSSSAVNANENFRLYFKGLISEERIRDRRVVVASVGVAIADPRDNLIWEKKKSLEAAEFVSSEIAEIEALIQGLDEALNLGLKRVTFLCDDYMVYQYVTGRVEPGQSRLATLVNQASLLQRKFLYCQPSLVARNDVKFVFKLARDAIVSQITWREESSQAPTLKETCLICFEDIKVERMFSIDGCYHRFCFSCMKQHVEVKLLNGNLAKCPHEGCESDVKIESCSKFLDARLVELMNERMKEASIALMEKVYCPYPRCSNLMSKRDVLEYTKQFRVNPEQSGVRKCKKCNLFFCINCKAPWHYNMTCYDYSRSNCDATRGDKMLKSLAASRRWKECAKCNNMVELASGCYHITCRCGYEFCYVCGAEWKNKKPTCLCPIWDERNILIPEGGRRR